MIFAKFKRDDQIRSSENDMEYASKLHSVWHETFIKLFTEILIKNAVDLRVIHKVMVDAPTLDRLSAYANNLKDVLGREYLELDEEPVDEEIDATGSKMQYLDFGVEPEVVRITSPNPEDLLPNIKFNSLTFFENIYQEFVNKNMQSTVDLPMMTILPTTQHVTTADMHVMGRKSFIAQYPTVEISIVSIAKSIARIRESNSDIIDEMNIISDDMAHRIHSEAQTYADITVGLILINLRQDYRLVVNSIVGIYELVFMKTVNASGTGLPREGFFSSQFNYALVNDVLMRPKAQFIWFLYLSKFATTTFDLFDPGTVNKMYMDLLKDTYKLTFIDRICLFRDSGRLKDFIPVFKEERNSYNIVVDDIISTVFRHLQLLKMKHSFHKDAKGENDHNGEYPEVAKSLEKKLQCITRMHSQLDSMGKLSSTMSPMYKILTSVIIKNVNDIYNELDDKLQKGVLDYVPENNILMESTTTLLNDISLYGYAPEAVVRLKAEMEGKKLTGSIKAAETAKKLKEEAEKHKDNKSVNSEAVGEFVYSMDKIIAQANANISKYKNL